MKFTQEQLRSLWGQDKKITMNGRLYRIGKMSYGDYFLEEKKDWNLRETDNHSNDTLWLERDKNGLYQVTS